MMAKFRQKPILVFTIYSEFQLPHRYCFEMKSFSSASRLLGRPIVFPSTGLQALIRQKTQILKSIEDNGCICIKNVDFQEQQLIEFTKNIWPEIITLPKFLCFNNQSETYLQVARVGNVLLDGTLKDSQKEAAYWHQDGNFWGEENKHIFNCLHTREQPDKGGDTHVMDLKDGAKFLKTVRPDVYRRLQSLVGILNIENINDFKLYNAKNTLNVQTITRHNLIRKNQQTGQECLFLSVHSLADKDTGKPCEDLTIAQVHEIIEKQMGFYAHKWQKGDLLIWDNLQVMHRSSGSFQGRRLLFRTQGRFK